MHMCIITSGSHIIIDSREGNCTYCAHTCTNNLHTRGFIPKSKICVSMCVINSKGQCLLHTLLKITKNVTLSHDFKLKNHIFSCFGHSVCVQRVFSYTKWLVSFHQFYFQCFAHS